MNITWYNSTYRPRGKFVDHAPYCVNKAAATYRKTVHELSSASVHWFVVLYLSALQNEGKPQGEQARQLEIISNGLIENRLGANTLRLYTWHEKAGQRSRIVSVCSIVGIPFVFCKRGSIFRLRQGLNRAISPINISAFGFIWKPSISSFIWGMVVLTALGSGCVTTQNVEVTCMMQAQLKNMLEYACKISICYTTANIFGSVDSPDFPLSDEV